MYYIFFCFWYVNDNYRNVWKEYILNVFVKLISFLKEVFKYKNGGCCKLVWVNLF